MERCEARGTALHVRLAKAIALIDMFRNGSGLAADRATLTACIPDAEPRRAWMPHWPNWSDGRSPYSGSIWTPGRYMPAATSISTARSAAAAQAAGVVDPCAARRACSQSWPSAITTKPVGCGGFKRNSSSWPTWTVAGRAGDAAGHFLLAFRGKKARKQRLPLAADLGYPQIN